MPHARAHTYLLFTIAAPAAGGAGAGIRAAAVKQRTAFDHNTSLHWHFARENPTEVNSEHRLNKSGKYRLHKQ